MKVNFNVVVEPSDIAYVKDLAALCEERLEEALNDLLEDAMMVGAALERTLPDIEGQIFNHSPDDHERAAVLTDDVAQFFAGSYVPETQGRVPQPAPRPSSKDLCLEKANEEIGHKEPSGYMYIYQATKGPGVFVIKDISNYNGFTPIAKRPYWLGNKEPV